LTLDGVTFAGSACAPPIEAMLAMVKTEIDCSNRDLDSTVKELDIAGLPHRPK
jgi:hypothetical protein